MSIKSVFSWETIYIRFPLYLRSYVDRVEKLVKTLFTQWYEEFCLPSLMLKDCKINADMCMSSANV
jgi:hypothetical protein